MDTDRGFLLTDIAVVGGIAHGIRGAIRSDHAVIDPAEGFPYVIVRAPDGCECILSFSDQIAMYDEDNRKWWSPDKAFEPAVLASAATAAYGDRFGVPEGHVESLVWLLNACRYDGVTQRVCVGHDTAEIAKHVEVVLSRWGRPLN